MNTDRMRCTQNMSAPDGFLQEIRWNNANKTNTPSDTHILINNHPTGNSFLPIKNKTFLPTSKSWTPPPPLQLTALLTAHPLPNYNSLGISSASHHHVRHRTSAADLFRQGQAHTPLRERDGTPHWSLVVFVFYFGIDGSGGGGRAFID